MGSRVGQPRTPLPRGSALRLDQVECLGTPYRTSPRIERSFVSHFAWSAHQKVARRQRGLVSCCSGASGSHYPDERLNGVIGNLDQRIDEVIGSPDFMTAAEVAALTGEWLDA